MNGPEDLCLVVVPFPGDAEATPKRFSAWQYVFKTARFYPDRFITRGVLVSALMKMFGDDTIRAEKALEDLLENSCIIFK